MLRKARTVGPSNRDGLTPLRLDLTDEQQLHDMRASRPLDEDLALAVSPATSSPEAAKTVQDEAAHAITKTVDDAAVSRTAAD